MSNENNKAMAVMILRDSARTSVLRALIRAQNGRAFSFPLYQFKTILDSKTTIEYLKNPNPYTWTIFASPNGVSSIRQIALKQNLALPKEQNCATPGQATKKALNAAGFRNVVAPRGVSDMATLLKAKEIGNLAKKRVAVVQRLNAPLKAMNDLIKKGAYPTLVSSYERVEGAKDCWQNADEEFRNNFNATIAFDAPSIELLLDRSKNDASKIKKLPLGVIHPTIAEKAKELGFENIITSGDSTRLVKGLNKLIQTGE